MTQPILSFLTSLRHPDTTDDYAAVERLLDASLRTLDAQQDRRFEVVVVANRAYRPPAGLGFAVRTIQVGFVRPVLDRSRNSEYLAAIKLDKGLKLAVAMAASTGAYAMCLDSDDYVSRRIVRFVADQPPGQQGWYVDRGMRYDAETGLYRRMRHFNEVCGTSLIWRRDLMPEVALGDNPDPADVLAAFGFERVTEELGSHRVLRRKYGLPAVPFRGAVYVVNHGRNHAPGAVSMLGWPIGTRRAAEFGIDAPAPSVQRRNALRQLLPTHLGKLAKATARRFAG